MTEQTEGKDSDIHFQHEPPNSYTAAGASVDSMRMTSVAGLSASSVRKLVREVGVKGVIFPWNKTYVVWWSVTVICAFLTIFTETFSIAFSPGGLTNDDPASIAVDYTLLAIFVVDLFVSFFVAYRDQNEILVYDRKLIAKHYLQNLFWIDVLGVFPFYAFALACAGQIGQDNTLTQYLALLRLIKLVRLQRVKQLFDVLQYTTKVSLTLMTIVRNISAAMIWSHFSACVLYFIARQYNFDPDNTWIGGQIADLDTFEAYIISLYWSMVTFATVGYGDYYPVNMMEQIWSIIFIVLNIIMSAWIIGSMTLLVVKHDEETSIFRDALAVLKQFVNMHNLDRSMHKGLKAQVKVEFKSRGISDKQVLSQFPSVVRRKVLRKLYLPSLSRTGLMKDLRHNVIDAFLAACTVEMLSASVEFLNRGAVCSELYLLIEGEVSLIKSTGVLRGRLSNSSNEVLVHAGEFVNEISFLTESPQVDTAETKTVCKILTITRAAYLSLTEDHPGFECKILHNLLAKVKVNAEEDPAVVVDLPKRLEFIRGGFAFEDPSIRQRPSTSDHQAHSSAALQDLIKLSICKHEDDLITRFLFAAARGNSSTILRMCDLGYDPNSSDYDGRTALMVAAMKGNIEVVKLLLNFSANPNLLDMSKTSALAEATKKGHDDTMKELMQHGAKLCIDEHSAASTLCQAVSDGDMLTLRRLLTARIHVDAADYDKRTAAHIAAAEGNTSAFKLLVEFGADLGSKDRWNRTPVDEAKQSNSCLILAFLEKAEVTGSMP